MKNLPLSLRIQPRCPKLKPGQIWIVFDSPERKQGTGLLVVVLKNNESGVVVAEAYANKKRKLSSKDFLVPKHGFISELHIDNFYAKSGIHVILQNIFCKKEGAFCTGYIYKNTLFQLEQSIR